MREKQEWIKYSSHGGGRPVWHLPEEGPGKILPACKSNGPVNGHVESVCYVEIIPCHGAVCADCARRMMNKLKFDALGAVKRQLIKEVTQCPNARIVKKP